ncbi:MAG: hypothetical protein KDD99_12850 [Bacteroidetes bacterium]|nr:hypothetical protein [Bacteroidota bacterium]
MKILNITIFFSFIGFSLPLWGQSDTWAFQYPVDPFTTEAKLDLRYLNESFAGEHGFIRLSEDGESFVRGDGQSIRFWAVNNGNATENMTDEELAYHARFMAKIGVNMGRFHGSINPPGKGTQIHEIDTAEVEKIWRYVAAMKKEGIYSTISPFWPHNGHMGGWVPEEWGIEGYSGKDPLWAVLYVDEKLQNAYKNWVRYLYTTPNPYTKVALKDEPAVGLIQIQNEDGVFFWTMNAIKPELTAKYEAKFAEWLDKKYDKITDVYAHWEQVKLEQDQPQNGRMGLYGMYDLTQSQTGGKAKRIADQTQFLAQLQYNFYKEIGRFYREDLGCKQLINPNNWITADIVRLNDLERWTYTSTDVPAVNRYNDPGHVGENSGWRIEPGHHYTGLSVLKYPQKLPINIKQTAGSPMLVTESGWNLPHVFQAEGPFMIAAYQSLTGVDAYYWFAVTSKAYMEDPYFSWHTYEDGQHPMNRWTCSAPWGVGMFPANALIFRKELIQEGKTVLMEKRSLDSLWARSKPVISEQASFDPNRDTGNPLQQAKEGDLITPLTFLTGPVKMEFTQQDEPSYISPELEKLINTRKGTVLSNTGEINLNYRQGVMKVNAPKTQGVSGFFAEGETVNLSDVKIMVESEYAIIQLVSMDNHSLNESGSVLVQTGTEWRPKNWQDEPATFKSRRDSIDGFKIINTGEMPWMGKKLNASIELRNSKLKKAWVLDAAGYPVREIPLIRKGKKCSLQLPEDAMYIVLEE